MVRSLVVGSLALAAPAVAAERDPFEAYRWNSRLLVISAADRDDPAAHSQREILAAARSGVKTRDLVLVEAYGDGPAALAIRRRLRFANGSFRAALVGKDGEAKFVSAHPIPVATLFDTIDAMPMRRQEMKR